MVNKGLLVFLVSLFFRFLSLYWEMFLPDILPLIIDKKPLYRQGIAPDTVLSPSILYLPSLPSPPAVPPPPAWFFSPFSRFADFLSFFGLVS